MIVRLNPVRLVESPIPAIEFDAPIGLRFVDLVEDLERVLGRKVDLLTPAGVHSIRRGEVAKAIAEDIVYVQ